MKYMYLWNDVSVFIVVEFSANMVDKLSGNITHSLNGTNVRF